jgi:type II secretory ATPase GspE/PulE/Tfp pilus assembly ATPase PilB-like protein
MIGEDRRPRNRLHRHRSGSHRPLRFQHRTRWIGPVASLLDCWKWGSNPISATSALKGILNQRLLRRSCPSCRASGCDACGNTGYRGRLLLAELLTIDAPLRRAILARNDTTTLQAVATSSQGVSGRTIRDSALQAVEAGWTTSAEVERVLGPSTHRAE